MYGSLHGDDTARPPRKPSALTGKSKARGTVTSGDDGSVAASEGTIAMGGSRPSNAPAAGPGAGRKEQQKRNPPDTGSHTICQYASSKSAARQIASLVKNLRF